MAKAFGDEGYAERIIYDAEYFFREWCSQDTGDPDLEESANTLMLEHLDFLRACTIAIRHCDLLSLATGNRTRLETTLSRVRNSTCAPEQALDVARRGSEFPELLLEWLMVLREDTDRLWQDAKMVESHSESSRNAILGATAEDASSSSPEKPLPEENHRLSEEQHQLVEPLPDEKEAGAESDIKALSEDHAELVEQLSKTTAVMPDIKTLAEEHCIVIEQLPGDKTTPVEPNIESLPGEQGRSIEQLPEEKITVVEPDIKTSFEEERHLVGQLPEERTVTEPDFNALSEEIRKLRLQMSDLYGWSREASRSITPSRSEIEQNFCLHDDGQVTVMAAAEISSSDQWMSRLQTSTNALWEKLPPLAGQPYRSGQQNFPRVSSMTQQSPRYPSEGRSKALIDLPVKIAIIDTGAAIEPSVLEEMYDSRLIECRSWIGKNSAHVVNHATADTVGHGTHAASLALKVTENTDCQIYVAQVFDRNPQQKPSHRNDRKVTAEAIALTIEYAVHRWKVDIISLSFGTDQAVDIIKSVIDKQAHKILFFAAASNCGGNEPGITWPARHGNVISIYASDGDGNSYKRNPNPMANHYNLSMLGTAVSGLWPQHLQPGSQYKHKSGTSCATPIAAGVAANIPTLMRRQATLYLSDIPKDELGQAVWESERLMRKLRRPQVMRRVMFTIGAHEIRRQGYHYVAPWHIFEGSPQVAFMRIKRVVDSS